MDGKTQRLVEGEEAFQSWRRVAVTRECSSKSADVAVVLVNIILRMSQLLVVVYDMVSHQHKSLSLAHTAPRYLDENMAGYRDENQRSCKGGMRDATQTQPRLDKIREHG